MVPCIAVKPPNPLSQFKLQFCTRIIANSVTTDDYVDDGCQGKMSAKQLRNNAYIPITHKQRIMEEKKVHRHVIVSLSSKLTCSIILTVP